MYAKTEFPNLKSASSAHNFNPHGSIASGHELSDLLSEFTNLNNIFYCAPCFVDWG